MLTLTDFLLARIAEDEAVAAPLASADTRSALREGSHYYIEATPTRIEAECAAKRRIVAEHEHQFTEGDGRLVGDAWACRTCRNNYPDWWCPTLRALALPYADHPDYRAEWRP